jgi:hypothetical protein
VVIVGFIGVEVFFRSLHGDIIWLSLYISLYPGGLSSLIFNPSTIPANKHDLRNKDNKESLVKINK